MKNIYLILILTLLTNHSAMSKKIINPSWGIQIELPKGWQIQFDTETDTYLLKESALHSAIVALHPVDHIESLQPLLKHFGEESFGENIQWTEEKTLQVNGISAQYHIRINEDIVNGEISGLLSPYGGGIIIMELCVNSEKEPGFVAALSQTVEFISPKINTETLSELEQWKEYLTNTQLTPHKEQDNYFEESERFPAETQIHLYNNKDFKLLSRESNSTVKEISEKKNSVMGKWEVRSMGSKIILKLRYEDKRVDFFYLKFFDSKNILLDDTPFLRIPLKQISEHYPDSN